MEQTCNIFRKSNDPFQRSYDSCGGFEMRCKQQLRGGACLSWEMGAIIPRANEDYYEFFLLQCPQKSKSVENVTIPNYTAKCNVSILLYIVFELFKLQFPRVQEFLFLVSKALSTKAFLPSDQENSI